MSDLQNWVNVALATAAGGEGDLAHDKLSRLRAVGSAFGPLIYTLPKEAGFHDLDKVFKPLLDTLGKNQELTFMLVYSSLFIYV